MKNIILATAITLLASSSAFAGRPAGCNPAIQNWENGSKTTCVFDSETKRNVEAQSVKVSAPPSEPDLNSQIK